ncbi:hypothetical protein [Nocardioides nitrophenolicus]|uniref:hypothetical protein n=1 Tax=Nocardioides nitrophenolicus TaxID=60489 RepID=UPI001957E63A|nr:hypothetical protein [Nocardioides nitrophenolicus]MBM7518143.1 hypothetical protein [Nocardioides nitrophenolicus]
MPTSRQLPPGVYWRRRVFVLGIAFALVFVIARVLTAGSDGRSGEQPAAEQAGGQVDPAADPSSDDTESAGAEGSRGTDAADGAVPPSVPTTPTLAVPDGECAAADVLVTPSIAEGAVAGRDVAITLSLQTRESEACTWQVSADSLVVKVAEGGRNVWTTSQCPQAVAAQSVVVRRAVPAAIQLTWAEARESTDGCTRRAGWADPGSFTVAAAALGGEPAEADFVLNAPVAETIQVTPDAKKTKKPKKSKTPVN